MPGNTAYPGGIDSYPRPDDSAGDELDTPGKEHDEMHGDAFAAIEAIETELGTNPSGTETDVAAAIAGLGAGLTSTITAVGERVAKAGDTMTGALNLYADPGSPTEAATKRYVDSIEDEIITALRPVLPLLSQAAFWCDARAPLDSDGNILDLSGRGNTLTTFAGALVPEGPARVVPDEARGRCLFTPGWDDMYIDTADPGTITALDFAWELDPDRLLQIDMGQVIDWLAHQGSVADSDFSWAVGIDSESNGVVVAYSTDGTTVHYLVSDVEFPTGTQRGAVTLDDTTGNLTIYHQPFTEPIDDFDLAYASWDILDTIAGAGAVALFNSSADVRHSGTVDRDTLGPGGATDHLDAWSAALYRMRLRDDIEGTDLAYLDVARIVTIPEWYVESGLPPVGGVTTAKALDFLGRAAETWTIHNYMTGSYPIVLADRAVIIFGNGSYAEAPVDDSTFDIADDVDFSVWIAYCGLRTGAVVTGDVMVALKNENAVDEGWAILRSANPALGPYGLVADGSSIALDNSPATTEGGTNVSGFNLDQSEPVGSGTIENDLTNTIESLTNGLTSEVPTDTSSLGSLSNPGAVMRVASYSDDGHATASFALAGLAIFRRKLTEFEAQVLLPYEFGLTLPIPEQGDEPWIPITLINGWAIPVATLPPRWRIKGDEVELSGIINGTAKSNDVFTTLTGHTALPAVPGRYIGATCTATLATFAGAAIATEQNGADTNLKAFFAVGNANVLLDGTIIPLT